MNKDEIIYLPDDGFLSRRVLSDAEIEAHVRAARESHDEAKSVYTEAEILAELDIQD